MSSIKTLYMFRAELLLFLILIKFLLLIKYIIIIIIIHRRL
jgi:hypothetical protein